jgi:beta-propeller repeat-containing protein/centrosomal CEP192-like protein
MKTRGLWTRIALCFGVAVLMPALISLSSRTAGQLWRSTAVNQSKAASEAPEVTRAKDSGSRVGTYGKLPLSFEENVGQTAGEVRFVSHGAGYELFLTPQEAVLALRSLPPLDRSLLHGRASFQALRDTRRASKASVLRVHLDGANPAPPIVGIDRLPGRVSYFIGNDPKKWRTDVSTYARVKYADVYPGVDLVFYGNQRRLEYDFVVAPGADPKAIQLQVEGARKLRIDSRGDLVLSVADGEVKFQKPVVYQEVKGKRQEIAGNYAVAGDHRVSFTVSGYDRSKPLIVDPVLNYSTYVGGSADETGEAIAVDAAGDAFVAGFTSSTDFPGASGSLSAANTNGAVFVTEINPTGTTQLYSTYLAGTGINGENALGIAVDPSGNIYVTGQTGSTDFPTTSNGLKHGTNVGNVNGTSFVSRIDPTLTGINQLVYSSYLGGTNGPVTSIAEFGAGIAADANHNVYVVGYTASSPGSALANFPVTSANAFQTTLGNSTVGNAFLTKIDTTQSGTSSLIYSTYLGGNGADQTTSPGFGDEALGVAVDVSSGNAYLVGTTFSTNFPTTSSALQKTAPAAVALGTAFVSRIDTTKSGNLSLIYSTYLGGNTSEFGTAIGLGPSNVAYVTGTTQSVLFPTTTGAFQTLGSAAGDVFISLIDTGKTGSLSLKYSTFLGGSQSSTAFGITTDVAGNAYVAGGTASTDFPVTKGTFQSSKATGATGDGFVAKLNPGGNGAADLVYSTYFGGSGSASGPDGANAIAIDKLENAYITGVTFSSASSFPVAPNPGAFQPTLKGLSDAFVAKLTLEPTVTVSPSSLSFGAQALGVTSAPQTVTLTNNGTVAVSISSIAVGAGSPAAANTDFAKASNTCGSSVAAGAQCKVGVTFKPSVPSAETATLVFTDSDATSPQNVALSGSGATPDFSVSATSSLSVTQGASGNFTVTVTPVNGFNQAVALSCTGAPAMATCTPSPASVTSSDGTTAVTSTVTVSTTAPSVVAPPSSTPTSPLSMRQVVPLLLALVLLLLLPRTQRRGARLALAGAMVVFLAVAGCGGGGHTKTGGTPKGTSNLTITGTSGNLTHSATVTLTVN